APRVHTRDARDGVPGEPAAEVVGRPPAAGSPDQIAHDNAAAERPPALVVGLGHAVVADVRVREGDDLARIGRVGDHLLIAGEHGVEDDLSGRHAAGRGGADGLALERGAVGQDEQRVITGITHRWASPSMTTGSPRSSVCRTRPASLRPAYGVLRLRLARRSGSTTHTAAGSITVRFAGAPSATGPPCWPVRPA